MKTPSFYHARTSLFFCLTFVVYTCVFPYLQGLNNPNENVRVYATMALVEHHSLHIDPLVARHGWVNDAARVGRVAGAAGGEGHLASVKGPLTSLLFAPVYAVLLAVGPVFGLAPSTDGPPAAGRPDRWLRASVFALRLAVQLTCFGALVAFERWLRRYSDDVCLRLSAVAAVGLGTNYLAYALSFTSHALFAVAAFGAFALLVGGENDRPRRAFTAGLMAGAATLLEYHALPVSCVLALQAAITFRRSRRAQFWFAAGAAVCAVVLLGTQAAAFGNPWTPGHLQSENEDYARILNQGFFGVGTPRLGVLYRLAMSRSHGLLALSPFLALAVVGAPVVAALDPSRRGLLVACAAPMAALFLTVSALANWRGGWSIGPRYLGAAPPFFAFAALLALEAVARRGALPRLIARSVAGGLALGSVLHVGLVAIVVPSLPEGITRPLPQIVVPLLRNGLTPWHLGHAFGAPWAWGAVAACMVGAALVACWPGPCPDLPSEARGAFACACVSALTMAAVIVVPAALPLPEPDMVGAEARAWFRTRWEP